MRVQKKSQTQKCPQARQGSTVTVKSSQSPADSYLPAQTHSRAWALSDMGVDSYPFRLLFLCFPKNFTKYMQLNLFQLNI